MVPPQLQQQLPAVGVPILERAVLAGAEQVVRVGHKGDLGAAATGSAINISMTVKDGSSASSRYLDSGGVFCVCPSVFAGEAGARGEGRLTAGRNPRAACALASAGGCCEWQQSTPTATAAATVAAAAKGELL